MSNKEVNEVPVLFNGTNTLEQKDNTTWSPSTTTGNYYWDGWTSPTVYTTWSTTVYKYQIFCPKPRCKKANWLELNQITACTKCGSLLKAVEKKADFEVEVE